MAISISETGFVEAKLEPSRFSLTSVILPSSAQAGNGKPTPTQKCFSVSESFRNSPFMLTS